MVARKAAGRRTGTVGDTRFVHRFGSWRNRAPDNVGAALKERQPERCFFLRVLGIGSLD
jgi:hypothetical protein